MFVVHLIRRKQCQIERILRNGKVYFSFFVAPSAACVKNYLFGNDVHIEVCIQKESKLRFFSFLHIHLRLYIHLDMITFASEYHFHSRIEFLLNYQLDKF